ncbi:MAG TPA: hypothetical protein VJI52_02875 [Candidatus Nanoarchaeia archaeon]|nr:hypothetical protein [Candidatus Nanoarchaeia archaeon]
MKLIIFAALFAILLALGISARGLEITEMRMSVDYSEAYTYQLEHKTRVDFADGLANNSRINADIFPGSNVTFTVRMENAPSGSGPGDRISQALVRIIIVGIDGGSDMDEDSDDFELEGGDDTLVDIKFPVPLDAATGTYDVFIDAQGEGRNGTFYFTENKLKLEVKKLSHDIQIVKYQLNPSILDCTNRKTKISADIMNLGSNDEEDIALEFKSGGLGINSIDKGISLDSSNDADDEGRKYTKILPLEISPKILPGVYPIMVNLYWRGSTVLFDREILNLDLRDCGSAVIQNRTVQNTNQNTISIPNQPIQAGSDNNSGPRLLQNISISGTPALMWIVLGAFVAFVLVIVIIFGYSRKGRQ